MASFLNLYTAIGFLAGFTIFVLVVACFIHSHAGEGEDSKFTDEQMESARAKYIRQVIAKRDQE